MPSLAARVTATSVLYIDFYNVKCQPLNPDRIFSIYYLHKQFGYWDENCTRPIVAGYAGRWRYASRAGQLTLPRLAAAMSLV